MISIVRRPNNRFVKALRPIADDSSRSSGDRATVVPTEPIEREYGHSLSRSSGDRATVVPCPSLRRCWAVRLSSLDRQATEQPLFPLLRQARNHRVVVVSIVRRQATEQPLFRRSSAGNHFAGALLGLDRQATEQPLFLSCSRAKRSLAYVSRSSGDRATVVPNRLREDRGHRGPGRPATEQPFLTSCLSCCPRDERVVSIVRRPSNRCYAWAQGNSPTRTSVDRATGSMTNTAIAARAAFVSIVRIPSNRCSCVRVPASLPEHPCLDRQATEQPLFRATFQRGRR